MSRTDYRGTTVPDPDDDLLAGLHTAFATAGIITRAASVSAARLAVDNAVAGGATVSSSRPMYFDIGAIVYRHDGTTLKPLNEVEAVEQPITSSDAVTVAAGVRSVLMTSTLSARPYDRLVTCWASAYGQVSGLVDLSLRVGGDDVLARFVTGTGASQSVTNTAIVAAGAAPQITLGVSGGTPGGGTIYPASDARLTRLVVTATPITMAG